MKKNYFSDGVFYPALNRWRNLLTIFFLLFSLSSMFGQASAYVPSETIVTGTAEEYAPITGTSVVLLDEGDPDNDDGIQNNINIGFTFNFGGVDYTTFSVSANGLIKLGSVIGGSNWTNALGNTATHRPLIAAFWDDNNLDSGSIVYNTVGTAPNRVLLINFQNTKIGSTGSTGGAAVSYLVKLYESTNVIEMVYGSPFTTTNGVTASVGLNDTGTFLSVTPAVISTYSFTTANNSINATAMANLAGKKLSFTPPACIAPSTGTSSAVTHNSATLEWISDFSDFEINWGTGTFVAGAGANTEIVSGDTSFTFSNTLTPTTTYRWFVRTNCDVDGYSVWAGPYTFTTTVPCPAPTAGTATAFTTTSATLGWTSTGTDFEINWGLNTTPLFAAGDGPNTETVSGNAFTFPDDLTQNTAYRWFVRRNCGDDGFSTWAGPFTFRTLCDVVTTLPYTENFDTYGTGTTAFPNCWIKPVNNSGYPSIVNVNAPPLSTVNSLRFQSAVGVPTYAVTPAFAEDIVNLRVKFSLRREGDNSGTITVGVMSNPSDLSSFEPLYTITPTNNTFNEYTYNLDTAISGENKHIAFRHNSITGSYYYWLDNVVVELIPTCPDQTGLVVANISSTGADFSWDDMSAAGDVTYEYAVTTSATPPTEGDETNDTFYVTTTDLTPQTTYYLHVRVKCDTDSYGAWITSPAFTTLCSTVTTLPYTENFNSHGTGTTVIPPCWIRPINNGGYPSIVNDTAAPLSLKFISPAAGATYAITPAFAEEIQNLRVKFSLKKEGANSGSFVIGVMSNPSDLATFEPIQTLTPASTDFIDYTVNLGTAVLTGGNRFIAFKHETILGNWYYWLDNVVVELIPTCPDQTGLVIGNISSTGADFSWDDMSAAGDVSYEYAVTTSATPPTEGDETNDTFYVTTTDLTPQTTYYLHVRVKCDTDSYGAWITSPAFTTLCSTVTTLPYTENFDTYGTGTTAFPTCWSRPVINNGYPSIENTNAAPLSTVNSLKFISPTNGSTYAITPAFSEDIQNLRVKFSLRREGTNSGSFVVGVMSSPSDLDSFEPIETITPEVNTFQAYTINLNTAVLSGGNRFIAFKHQTIGNNWYYWLDNVVVELIPACPDLTDITVTNITATGADISWTNMEVLGYQYFISESATPPATGLSTTATFYIAEDELTPLTNYYVHVRTDCGDGANGVWISKSFKTACLPPNITGTTPGSVCGQGVVELSATAEAGANIAWYASQTGGSKIGDGETFITPLINEPTSYWVAAYSGEGITTGQAKQTFTGTNPGGYTLTAGLEFVATDAFTLVSVVAYSYATTGTTIPRIQLQNSAGVMIQEITNVSIPNGGTSGATAVPFTITLNFAVPGPGTYRLMADGTFSSLTRDTTAANVAFPYAVGDVAQITQGILTANAAPNAYYFFYDWTIGSGCTSSRTEVVASVTPAEPITLSESAVEICSGEDSDVVTLTSDIENYDTYVWEPLTGVSGDESTGWIFNTTETTTYTLTASQSEGDCATSIVVEVTVNALPSVNGITASATEICEGASVNIAANVPAIANYCSVAFSNAVEPITLVNFQGINNATSATVGGTPALENFTAMVANVTADNTYSITVNGNTDGTSYTNNFWVYIDWNQNGVFTDLGETYSIGTITGNDGTGIPLTFDGINVPADALNGNTRMRVLKKFSAATNPGSCNTTGFGQAEDYTINVSGGIDLDTYSWSDGTSEVGTEVSLTVTPDATTTYTVTVTNSAGCTVTESVIITVNEVPEAPTATSPQTLTEGQTLADLVVTATGDLIWYSDAGLTTVVPSTTLAVDGTTYYVAQSNGSCTSEATPISVEVTLGTGNFDNVTFKVYPNPTKNILFISCNQEISNVEVYNMVGQRVNNFTLNANQGQIDMSNLASGAYFIKVASDNITKTVKVIKE
jgi:hypothetical protein